MKTKYKNWNCSKTVGWSYLDISWSQDGPQHVPHPAAWEVLGGQKDGWKKDLDGEGRVGMEWPLDSS